MSHICLEPAATVLSILGRGDQRAGRRLAREVLQVDRSRVHRWGYPKGRAGGTGGHIPRDQAEKLLHYAQTAGIPLRPEHFFQRPANRSLEASVAA